MAGFFFSYMKIIHVGRMIQWVGRAITIADHLDVGVGSFY